MLDWQKRCQVTSFGPEPWCPDGIRDRQASRAAASVFRLSCPSPQTALNPQQVPWPESPERSVLRPLELLPRPESLPSLELRSLELPTVQLPELQACPEYEPPAS